MTDRSAAREPWHTLIAFTLPSEPGNDRAAVERVAAAVQALNLASAQLDGLKTAVAEAALNGIEHGNRYQPELLLEVEVLVSETAVKVRITDQGSDPIPETTEPDLEAKLAGQQSTRGWGLFLMRSMVDEVRTCDGEDHHTVELLQKLATPDRR